MNFLDLAEREPGVELELDDTLEVILSLTGQHVGPLHRHDRGRDLAAGGKEVFLDIFARGFVIANHHDIHVCDIAHATDLLLTGSLGQLDLESPDEDLAAEYARVVLMLLEDVLCVTGDFLRFAQLDPLLGEVDLVSPESPARDSHSHEQAQEEKKRHPTRRRIRRPEPLDDRQKTRAEPPRAVLQGMDQSGGFPAFARAFVAAMAVTIALSMSIAAFPPVPVRPRGGGFGGFGMCRCRRMSAHWTQFIGKAPSPQAV